MNKNIKLLEFKVPCDYDEMSFAMERGGLYTQTWHTAQSDSVKWKADNKIKFMKQFEESEVKMAVGATNLRVSLNKMKEAKIGTGAAARGFRQKKSDLEGKNKPVEISAKEEAELKALKSSKKNACCTIF